MLAREVEPYEITVNAFGPGPTDTPLLRAGVPPEQMELTRSHSTFNRLPTPEQGAKLAVWFTRPETAHITAGSSSRGFERRPGSWQGQGTGTHDTAEE